MQVINHDFVVLSQIFDLIPNTMEMKAIEHGWAIAFMWSKQGPEQYFANMVLFQNN